MLYHIRKAIIVVKIHTIYRNRSAYFKFTLLDMLADQHNRSL